MVESIRKIAHKDNHDEHELIQEKERELLTMTET